MNKYTKLILAASFLVFANTSFAGGGFFCMIAVSGEEPKGWNKDLCEQIEEQCLPSGFTRIFKSRFGVVVQVDSKDGSIFGITTSGNEFLDVEKTSIVRRSADYLKQNPIANTKPNEQLIWQVQKTMCESSKIFANSYLNKNNGDSK